MINKNLLRYISCVNLMPMKYVCLLLLIAFFPLVANSQIDNPITVRVGSKIDKLVLKSGKVYDKVQVLKFSSKGVAIMWSGGITNIPQSELPEYNHLFIDEEEEGSSEKVASKKQGKSKLEEVADEKPKTFKSKSWQPKSVDEVIEACVMVKSEIHEKGYIKKGGGSAFLVNHGRYTYLYSNVHNFFGAKKIELLYHNGKKMPLSLLGTVEVADGKYGLFRKINNSRVGWGGDIIRIRLKKFHVKALKIANEIADETFINREIVVTGNTRAKWKVTQLKGKITHLGDYDIIHHNAKTEAGNSGSPIIDVKTFKVLGILTWGGYNSSKHLSRVWSKKDINEREGINSGASLGRIKYKKSSLASLEKEATIRDNIHRGIRLLGLMDVLVPSTRGLFVVSDQKVMGDYTVDDLLRESPNHYIVRRLVALDKLLKKRKGKLKMSNQDLFKLYLPAYTDCLAHAKRQRGAIELYLRNNSFYFQCLLKNTYALEINRAYEGAIGRSIGWYHKQRGVKGKSIAIGERVRLPRLSSGLEGLGLQKE